MPVIETLNEVALFLGYGVMAIVGLLFALRAYTLYAWENASQDAKEMGAAFKNETGVDAGVSAALFDSLIENMDHDFNPDCELEYEPWAGASFDWSVGGSLEEADIRRAKRALESAGFHVHPFPEDPDSIGGPDGWSWSQRHMGVWRDEPTFFVDDKEEDERTEVETDLTNWVIDTS